MFEKKRGTRFLASVMALVMLLSLAPVGALAADEPPTNEECSTVPLPANEDNPKPVVTDEENTANTNEEPTSPPRNEDYAETPADNNDASTAISETPVISDPVQDLTGDVLYDLYDFNGRQPGANIGYVRKNYTVTYNANLPNGASLISGVTLPDAQTFSTSGMVVRIKDLSGRNSYNRDAQVSGENKYYKFLGWAETSDATTAKYTPGQYFSVFRNTTLYAVWERNDKDVMYFVLMPGIDAPSNGADQGYQKYYPNKTDENDQKGDDGGVSGCTVYTGYTGGNLTETGFNAVPTEGNSVVDLAGQYSNSTYLSVPSNLGYFNANTKTDELNLDMTGKEIVWYVIKNQEDGYHVDGYVKNVPIKVRYHENFNGDTTVKDTVTGIVSGGTVIVKTAGAVFGEGYTHQGYTFAGWSTSQGEDGTVYQPGNQTEQLVTSLDLYAKWTKTDPNPDPTPAPSTPVPAMFFINLGGKDASKPDGSGLFTRPAIVINEAINLDVFTTHAKKGYGNNGYIFKEDGVKNQYTDLLKNEPTSVQINEKLPADKKESMSVGDGTGREVVWYHVSDCTNMSDGYHVDGYIKNVAIKITYNPNNGSFDTAVQVNDSGNYEVDGISGTTHSIIQATPTRDDHIFTGWKLDNKGTLYKSGDSIIPTGDVTLVAQWKEADTSSTTADYTVNHYKWDITTKNYILDVSEKKQGEVDTEVTATAKTYTDYTLNTQASTLKGTVAADNKLTLNLYYDIDKIGDGENKDQPDGIPDRYQVTINYVSSNTNWGSVNRSKEVITLTNKESGKWLETGTVTAPSCTATSAGGKCYFVNWTKKQEGTTDVSTVDSTANLPEQTIENAKGGDVYTFTANFDRSSGGGSGGSNRPKPPVVEIPDDVPTGLNGKDHYAYIIGYGNNDVRPQNNITRAEVATIFFRLLTDETREANMTKSNGYNDVKDGDWFCCAVSTLSKMGIIKGYEDGSFKPNDPISRAEFAAIAARFDPDGDKTPATFADVTSHWAKDEISIAANHGWIKGYEDGSFKPDQKITRAETMTLVNRVLNRLPEAKDDLHKDMKTWVDNMDETAWYYLAVQEATNSHYFKNKTSTKFEQWTDLRDTRDWSELEK